MADLGAAGSLPLLGIVGWLFAAGGLSILAFKLHNGKAKELGSRRLITLKWAALTALALFNWSFSASLIGTALWTALLGVTAFLFGIVGYMVLKMTTPTRVEKAARGKSASQAKRAMGAKKAKRAGAKRVKRARRKVR